MGAGVSHAESLRGWSCSIAYRMWKNGWEGEEEKSCCTLMLLTPKALHRSQILFVVVWHGVCIHVLLLLGQPRCLPCKRPISQYLTVTVLPAFPPLSHGIGGPQHHSGHCGKSCPLCPLHPTQFTTGWKETCRAEALIGVKGLAVTSAAGWMSLKVREGKKNTQPKPS